MQSRTLLSILGGTLLFTLNGPLQVSAQAQDKSQPRYRLVDLGTFGGPNSYSGASDPQTHILNGHGAVIGSSDTSISDPFAPNCVDADCFVSHGFLWQNNVLKDLGASGWSIPTEAG